MGVLYVLCSSVQNDTPTTASNMSGDKHIQSPDTLTVLILSRSLGAHVRDTLQSKSPNSVGLICSEALHVFSKRKL